jgi:hypothetical protein
VAHVRFEERVALAILERRLAAPDLERLGRAIAQAESRASIAARPGGMVV